MTITFRSRPLTPAETAAGWEAVLVPDVPQLKPTYLAHEADIPNFPHSPMGQMMAKILGATIVVEHDAR